MLQVPVATSVTVEPATVQTADVDERNVTGRPELAVAASWIGPLPSVAFASRPNVMVCGVSCVMVVTSFAVSFAVLISAGLLTVAVFVTLAGAVAETLTVTEMTG